MVSFGHNHYVPVLKGKLGEFRALEVLTGEIKDSMTPLLEVPPIPWDFEEEVPARTVDHHLRTFVPNIEKFWGADHIIFVDMNFIPEDVRMKDSDHPLTWVFNQAKDKGLQLIPVTGIRRDEEYQRAVKDVVSQDGRGFCIRIETTDIEDEELEATLEQLITNLDARKSETHLILDLKEIQKDQIGLLVRSLRDVIRTLPEPLEWKTLTLCATAFPQTMSGFAPDSINLTSRVEWQLWTTLLHNASKIPRMPTFGDYTIVHPELLEIDPRIMQLGAKIKYTFDNDWIIVKGTSIRRGGPDQTRDLCKNIIELSEYRGSTFSWGDNYIKECADGTVGVGNQTTWVTVGVNHHIVFVINQLSSYSASVESRDS